MGSLASHKGVRFLVWHPVVYVEEAIFLGSVCFTWNSLSESVCPALPHALLVVAHLDSSRNFTFASHIQQAAAPEARHQVKDCLRQLVQQASRQTSFVELVM